MHRKIGRQIVKTSLPTRCRVDELIKAKLLTIGSDRRCQILDSGCWLLAVDCGLVVAGCSIFYVGYSAPDARWWLPAAGLGLGVACLVPLAKQLYEDNLPLKGL